MHFSYPLLCFLFLDITTAHQIPYSFRTHKRQNGPDNADLQVNIHPEAAKALSAFLKLDTTLDSCGVDLPSLEQPGEPEIPVDINKRVNPMSGKQLIRCLHGIGKAVVPAFSTGHILEPMVKFVKDIQVNLDFITYKDPEIQREASDLLLYGADSLHQMIPSLSFDNANKLLQAVFAAEYARVVDQVENLALFSLANRLLEKQSDKDTCPKTTTGDEHGMVDCPNPLCDGKDGVCTRPIAFHGCPCSDFVCPTEDDIPYCDKCGGDDLKSKCRGLPDKGQKYKGCECMVTETSSPWTSTNHAFYDLQRFIGKPAAQEPVLECSSSKSKFANWEAAMSAMGDFCRDPKRLHSDVASADELKNGKVINAHYNNGVYDEMDVRITWYQNDRIDETGCRKFFTAIIDGCDINENDKHGGSYTYRQSGNANKILIAEILPSGSLRKSEPRCPDQNGHYSAPRDDDNSGGVTVNSAIAQWCSDNHGKRIDWLVSEDISWRFPINNLQVPDRSSFWLRANMNDECNPIHGAHPTKEATFDKDQCIQALHDGMNQCDDKKTRTHGHTTESNCVDYSIILSGITRSGDKDTAPSCANGQAGRPLSSTDIDAAIDGFCTNGAEIKGYGKHGENMYDFPAEGQPQFYNNDLYKMHLTMGAETVENGGPVPYKNMKWCGGYDWKMGRDDCLYALRRIYQDCADAKRIQGGTYTYRCVRYKSWHINTRDS
ncbi:uncharacterized protein Bfra_012046 [Botrytis fragariae]|uniref:Uncharacterized protein n=1 Tax=Botrytis fragariae TaxID=1964551 RepID=A0A8H6AK07_9HELO|nr:uncharacterized protein Bfra_012046 [Botrytis fragariae]KAF5868715.1 hypothetical protein Bfra_012046 [Botrytis fragariae]